MTLEYLPSEALLPLRHGFFTRRGGASSGIFEGLNCGLGSTDQREIVLMNRSRVAAAMGVGPEALVTINQVHSSNVRAIAEPSDARGVDADAMVTATPGLAIAVLTADCQPVLFADPVADVVGAAHAGWKGALDGVLEATVEAMTVLGARRERIRAAIGPTIGQDAYEVGPEFLDRFLAADATNRDFFRPGAGDRQHFDLQGYALRRLAATGIAGAASLGRCTYSEPDLFYSYRRSVHRGEADYGRLISAIRC